jgi:hypothetical protein
MKKLLVVFMAVLLSVAFVGAVYAQGDTSNAQQAFDKKFATAKTATVEGTVVSHDVKCHCIVVKGPNGNVVVQDDYAEFNQEYNKAKGLKLNAAAKITYKTVDSINYATKVEQK